MQERVHLVSGASRDGDNPRLPRPCDEFLVARPDWLGRDTRDVLDLIYECVQKEAFVTGLNPSGLHRRTEESPSSVSLRVNSEIGGQPLRLGRVSFESGADHRVESGLSRVAPRRRAEGADGQALAKPGAL
jgi:hypothetical protein